MNRLDVLQFVCDITDQDMSDSITEIKLLRYIDTAYTECLRREYKSLPDTKLDDTTLFLTDDRNMPFIGFYSAWLHFMNEQDTALAGIMKDEYEGFMIYKPSKTIIPITDVYEVGEFNE